MNLKPKISQASIIDRLIKAVEELDSICGERAEGEKRIREANSRFEETMKAEHSALLKDTKSLDELRAEESQLKRKLASMAQGSEGHHILSSRLKDCKRRLSQFESKRDTQLAEREMLRRNIDETKRILASLQKEHFSVSSKIADRHLLVQIVKWITGDAEAARKSALEAEIASSGVKAKDLNDALKAAGREISVLDVELRGIVSEIPTLEQEIHQLEEAMACRETVDALQKQIAELQIWEHHRREEAMGKLRSKKQLQLADLEKQKIEHESNLADHWRAALAKISELSQRIRTRQQRLDQIDDGALMPDGPTPDALVVGRLRLEFGDWSDAVPLLTPFPFTNALKLDADDAQTVPFVEGLLLRLITALSCGGLRILVCDPHNLGQSLGGVQPLLKNGLFPHGRVLTRTEDIEAALREEADALEDIIQTRFKDPEMTWIRYNREHPSTKLEYRVFVLFNMPEQLTERSLHFLGRLVEHGPRCGILPILTLNTDTQDNRNFSRFLSGSESLLVDRKHLHTSRPHAITLLKVENRLEPMPGHRELDVLLAKIADRYSKLGFQTRPIAELWQDEPWTESSADGLRAMIGWQADGSPTFFEIGGVGTEHHGLLAGRSGTGKSNLLHVLIHSLCHQYSPEELRIFLLDYKQGTELAAYANPALPHAALVATESDPEYGITVLEHLATEMERRASDYKRLGISEFTDYRRRFSQTSPRWLLIIDEFQALFAEGRQIAENAEKLLVQLLRQGRARGIHVLLSTQSLKGIQTQSMGQLISNIGLRICLACSEEDSAAVLAAANWEAARLKSPPEALINNSSGSKSANIVFRVPKADDALRKEQLFRMRQLAQEGDFNTETKIYDGSRLPQIPSLDEWLDKGKTSVGNPALLLGRRLDYEANIESWVLAKRPGANLLVAGPDATIRMGLIKAIARSFRWANPEGRLLLLHSRPGDEDAALVWGEVDVTPDVLSPEWDGEIPPPPNGASSGPTLLLIDCLDFATRLHSGVGIGTKASPVTAAFKRTLEEGPPHECWTVAFADNWPRVSTLCKELLSSFQFRVGFGLNEDHAGGLASGGYEKVRGLDHPHRAIFVDQHQNRRSWFRPFAPADTTKEDLHG